MRIAITADPFIPVPPINYGGIERVIDFLVNGYLELGHEVLLLAHPDSQSKAEIWKYPSTKDSKIGVVLNASLVSRLQSWRPDVIHSFGRLAYLLTLLPSRTPKIMSYQREPTLRTIQLAMRLAKRDSLMFTGCSDYITNQIKPFAPATTVYNGVPKGVYNFVDALTSNAPLVFLGKIDYTKGPHLAIEIAKEAGEKLVIAGNVPTDAKGRTYFEQQVQPYIDGDQIQYIGPVNDQQKNDLLGNAKAFLMPIFWNEPFGIVMAEAMACGTPIIGFRKGSVPEVVDHGKTGYIVDNKQEMISAVGAIHQLSRNTVHKTFLERFSANKIVADYLNLYQQLL